MRAARRPIPIHFAGVALESAVTVAGGQVGHHLHLHPGTAAMGVFDEPVRWWEGTLQARWSAELRQRLGPYAPVFETVPVHPGTAAAALPWRSAADHRALMEGSANLSLVGVLGRDAGAGRVRIDRDGSPRVRWRPAREDEARLPDTRVQAAVPARVDHVRSGGDDSNRHASTIETASVRGAVHPERETAHDRQARRTDAAADHGLERSNKTFVCVSE
jgi:hypothetical protein